MRFVRLLGSNKYIRDVRTFPAAAAAAWRRAGGQGVWWEVLERSLHRLHGRALIVEQDLEALADVSLPAGVMIRSLEGTDPRVLREIAARSDIERFRRALAGERTCLVAWRRQEPIGYAWISRHVDPDIERYALLLPTGAVYMWGLYVVPHERNGGVGSALASARLHHARERGFRCAWRLVVRGNRASQRTLEKSTQAGFRVVGELSYLKLFETRTWFRAIAPAGGSGSPPR